MKIFTQGFLARRKIVFIFVLAILLPSLIVGYLSFRAFSNRLEAVRRVLESNLWISGEAALNSVEGALLEHERDAIRSENFTRLTQLKRIDQNLLTHSFPSKNFPGKLFLLDTEYQIVFPETGSGDISTFPWEKNIPDSEFSQTLDRAESFEFSQKNYSRAAELYRKCTLNAPSEQLKALALEALGRCLLSSRKYDGAYKAYSELSAEYGQLRNKAGHPYGILAALQLCEIAMGQNKEENGMRVLLDLYKKIRDGAWLLNLASYDFFISEIESALDNRCREGKFPEIQKSYQALQTRQSPYLSTLLFADFLKRDVIPGIKEKLTLSRMGGEEKQGRFLAAQREDFRLVSYTTLPDFRDEQTFYGGLCWDTDSLKQEIFPEVLGNVTKDSGLQVQIIDGGGRNILSGKEALSSRDSLSLSYRQFPLPWKILVYQPALQDLERTARRENFFYGVLLAFIVALMLLGAFLIARDISRESETTRLKTEFVHNISHEFKTPLTLIRLYGETLQRKENLANKERHEAYEIITKESERLSHLINNVLDFSRIDMGRKEFDFKQGDLSSVVRDTLESYRYHLEKKGFAIQEEIAPDIPEMYFDPEAIASVLVNLLSNAMKFSPNKKEVTVRLFKEGGNAILQVADKGIGISPKEISRIFRRFYRSEQKTVSGARGSGLGLTLVKHITEAHGGRIKVDSEPGKGSIFSIILPISRHNKDEIK